MGEDNIAILSEIAFVKVIVGRIRYSAYFLSSLGFFLWFVVHT